MNTMTGSAKHTGFWNRDDQALHNTTALFWSAAPSQPDGNISYDQNKLSTREWLAFAYKKTFNIHELVFLTQAGEIITTRKEVTLF